MTLAQNSQPISIGLPDHTQLPESDGTFVKNFQEHPQSIVLTESMQRITCIDIKPVGVLWRQCEVYLFAVPTAIAG